MKHTKEFAAKRAILEAHAAQLLEDVIRELYEAGGECAELLTEKIDELNEHLFVWGKKVRLPFRVCWYCKRVRPVRLCKRCRHFVCGWKDCPGSPCPKGKRHGMALAEKYK